MDPIVISIANPPSPSVMECSRGGEKHSRFYQVLDRWYRVGKSDKGKKWRSVYNRENVLVGYVWRTGNGKWKAYHASGNFICERWWQRGAVESIGGKPFDEKHDL